MAVVGACKEKGGSFPLLPSHPLDPSLVFFSMQHLSLSAFSDCKPGIPAVSLFSQSVSQSDRLTDSQKLLQLHSASIRLKL